MNTQNPAKRLSWLPLVSAWILILGVAGALFARYPARYEPGTMQIPADFEVAIKARDLVYSGHNPYVASSTVPFDYPPGFLVLLKGLPERAQDAWPFFGMLNVILLVMTLMGGLRYSTWRSVGLLVVGLAISWKGLLEVLNYGQLEIIILAISVAATGMFRYNRIVSGFLIGTLPWIKLPWLALSIPFLVTASHQSSKRMGNWVAGYCIACFYWSAALPSMIFGPDRALALSQGWITALKNLPMDQFMSPINQSLWVSLTRVVGNELVALGLGALLAGWFLGRLMKFPIPLTKFRATEEGGIVGWITPWLVFLHMLNPIAWRWGSLFLVGLPLGSLKGRERWINHRAIRLSLWAVVVFLLALQVPFVVDELGGFLHGIDLYSNGLITAYWALIMVLSL